MRSLIVYFQMTREEALAFLQEIKTSLEFLQTHYAQLRDKERQRQQAKVSQYFDVGCRQDLF
jgi:hypothetical protein